MATLGTQNISTSYVQLIKTSGLTGIDATIQTITDGNNVSSALQLSSAGVNSTGTLNAVGATTLASSLAVTGAATFSSSISATTGTATLGTIASTTITNSGIATVGTLKVGASGPSLTAVVFATAAYTGATVLDIDHATTGSNVSTGTLAASGVALGDMVIGNINSIGSTTGATPAGLLQDFRIESAGVLRFTIFNSTQTTGTIPAGTIFATALRFTA
jgi:hypothetical protein